MYSYELVNKYLYGIHFQRRYSQVVKGCIIALEDDQKIKNALKMVNGIEFYKYEINFNLSIVNT